jgi:hypothetical protein
MPDILELIKSKDRLDYSQNYKVKRPYKGNTLFPDIKTPNLEAEYYRLSQGSALPTVAEVHAFDTEAKIGTRPTLEHISVEKFFIKEKINQSEKTAQYTKNGVDTTGLLSFIFDDMGRLADSVVARAELMKQTLMATGKLVVSENGLNLNISLGVPSDNYVTANWSDPEHDILGDLAAWKKIAKEQGQTITHVQTSDKILGFMQKNKGIQISINSSLGVGAFVPVTQVNALMQQMFGFTIDTDEDVYATLEKQSDGTLKRKSTRFFAEDKFVMYTANANGKLGTGLWGVTPEEQSYGPWTEKSQKQFVTITQWSTADPVATWTKASGLFVPVVPNPEGMIIATITFDEVGSLDNLNVISAAGTNVGDTKITVSPTLTSGNTYKYKVADNCTLPDYGTNVKLMSPWDGTSDITAATGKEILIIECDSTYKAVKAGIATVTAKA